VKFDLDRDTLSVWNPETGEWENYGGKYTIEVGSSSRDIRAKASFVLAGR
jgi:hypothetical protein